MKYGWFIRGKRTKLFVRVVAPSRLHALETPNEATMFLTAADAQACLDVLVMAEDLEVVDMAIHNPLPPDADQTPIQTRDEVIAAALAADRLQEAKRRATWGLIEKTVMAFVLLLAALVQPAHAHPRDLHPSTTWSKTHAAHHYSRTPSAHRTVSHARVHTLRVRARVVRVHIAPHAAPGARVNVARDAVAVAERYLGGNPTGRASLWCADFANFVERQLGRAGTHSREALSFLRYGPHVSNPAPGDLVVLGRRGGGHVGYLIKQTPAGPLIVSGNHGHRVGIGVYPSHNVIAYVRPS